MNECPQEVKNKILKEEMPKAIKVFQQVIEGFIEKGEFVQNLDSKIAAYIMVMSISNLEYYAYDEGEDVMSVLMGIIDTLAYSMSRSI